MKHFRLILSLMNCCVKYKNTLWSLRTEKLWTVLLNELIIPAFWQEKWNVASNNILLKNKFMTTY